MSVTPSKTLVSKTLALIGNPNTGKTTLFNILTGLSQQVGNYPGVTVERKSGRINLGAGQVIDLLDLPGTYSLAAHSPDQMIAVDVLLGHQEGEAPVDAIIAIVDASNLNRNLYLVSQLIETDLPLVIALNMTDLAQERGIQIDVATLEERLGIPIVPISAHRRQGIENLLQTIESLAENAKAVAPKSRPKYPEALQRQAKRLTAQSLPVAGGVSRKLSKLEAFRALIDQGGHVEKRLVEILGEKFAHELDAMRQTIALATPLSALETETRYDWINQLLDDCVQQPAPLLSRRSDAIDRILTHKIFGFLIFFALSTLAFQAIFKWATPLMDWIDEFFAILGAWIENALPAGALQSLLTDGVIAGVGGVLIFLPQIAILFLFISILEDCGYMARSALLMDRLLTWCGLSGKSFIPLLSSFACAVPAIMATRTIEDRHDRLTTILVAPLVSCSARLPVYIIFIAAFIPERPFLGTFLGLQGVTLFAMYSIGILVAIPVAWLLKKTLLKSEVSPLLLELPSYKWPNPHTVFLKVYQNSKSFVLRAGSIILATTIVMWALAYFPRPDETRQHYEGERTRVLATSSAETRQSDLAALDQAEAAELIKQSYLGQAGQFIEPAVRPLGWDWRIGMATLASFPAREVVISVLGTIYSLGGKHDESSEDLRQALQEAVWQDGKPIFTIPVALSIMVFFALCAQCMSTLAIIQRETLSWGWAGLNFAYMTLLAYAGAFITYQVTMFLGWGA